MAKQPKNNMKKLTWLQLMWKNSYIQLFILAIFILGYTIVKADTFYTTGSFLAALSIPLGMMSLIAYLGFYKFWKYYKALK